MAEEEVGNNQPLEIPAQYWQSGSRNATFQNDEMRTVEYDLGLRQFNEQKGRCAQKRQSLFFTYFVECGRDLYEEFFTLKFMKVQEDGGNSNSLDDDELKKNLANKIFGYLARCEF